MHDKKRGHIFCVIINSTSPNDGSNRIGYIELSSYYLSANKKITYEEVLVLELLGLEGLDVILNVTALFHLIKAGPAQKGIDH